MIDFVVAGKCRVRRLAPNVEGPTGSVMTIRAVDAVGEFVGVAVGTGVAGTGPPEPVPPPPPPPHPVSIATASSATAFLIATFFITAPSVRSRCRACTTARRRVR
ncbi:MAG TPA: hypothetical protein VK665_09485 [Candidatus Elarobacter sp.]|nr:hypothetical protein [Candidatus Elarobacter sp.]